MTARSILEQFWPRKVNYIVDCVQCSGLLWFTLGQSVTRVAGSIMVSTLTTWDLLLVISSGYTAVADLFVFFSVGYPAASLYRNKNSVTDTEDVRGCNGRINEMK